MHLFFKPQLRTQISLAEQKLKVAVRECARKRRERESKRNALQEVVASNPQLRKRLKVRERTGRPRLEDDQPLLLQTIIKIAQAHGGADARRRSEAMQLCRTLDDLVAELRAGGFTISRSAAYLRLLPRRANAGDGPRHVTTVPVKLVKAQTSEHRRHMDTEFALATVRQVECVVSMLGQGQAFFLSQDDKARVPLGITAANKQAPLLMHMEYKVTLADHDFAVAPAHKLIPSVYAACSIKAGVLGDERAVSYSGPTYIAIRSGKHSSSTAASHAVDFNTIYTLAEFREFVRDKDGAPKPVVAISVDGGPDEAPRHRAVLVEAVRHFRKLELDALFVVANAPGRSAYNRVERRMAPLSKELSGLVLPHDFFGSHLDASKRTTDDRLEQANFGAAAMILADVWSDLVIDGHPVVAEYVPEPTPGSDDGEHHDDDGGEEDAVSAAWLADHVRQSQYLLQIVKCPNRLCCDQLRSNLASVLPQRFLPPPVKVAHNSDGLLTVSDPASAEGNFPNLLAMTALNIPNKPSVYDFFCPSVQNDLEARTCDFCGLYFPSITAKKEHIKELHGRAFVDAEEIDDTLVHNFVNPPDPSPDVPLIANVNEWLATPFVEDQ
ncbi:Cytochrome b6-f complex iron-sulfur subunit [Frankliniella fusca]|uniref:Cytochrome b6-f complex iron-sulfur subunit n=1 Tax=Frankliniella fusca TaxID=407009 RepID=A0AAE1L6L2_9NEOP|nr:Cytochrome b6-f complex iron-sulfur subunit [Frankliniella fusca]